MRSVWIFLALLLTGILPQAAVAGTIVGTLKSPWLGRYPMVVYLEAADGRFTPPKEKPQLDQKNKMFVPHVITAVQGTTIHYVNNDDTKHNVYFVQPDGKQVNLGDGITGWSKDQKMDQIGVYPHRCNVHEEMSAFLVVTQNPFFAVLEKGKAEQKFRLDGVPPGNYKLRVWCEKFYENKSHAFNRPWEVTIQDGRETVIEVKP